MSTSYPSGTDSYSTHSDATNEVIHASTINNLQDAVVALETELGANPRGSYSTVAARLAAGGAVSTARQLTALGNSGSTFTVPASASVTVTLTANATVTLPTVSAGYEHVLRLILTQDTTGSRTVTWPAHMIWPGFTPPTLSTFAGSVDIIQLSTVDAGTTWAGVLVAANLRESAPPGFAAWIPGTAATSVSEASRPWNLVS